MVAPSATDNFSVSVIIPTYNRSSFLRSALDSVYSQSHQVNEIIVVDDGSTDLTVEELSADYESVSFIRQENQGVSSARNNGIEKAEGEWIALLDSDDRWDQNKIARQLSFLSQNPAIQICHTGEKWIRNGKLISPPSFLDKSNDGLFERSLERCIICPSSVLFHRSVIDAIGNFDENLSICEDYDFWIRLLLSYPIGLVKEPLVEKYGGHADQLSMSTWGLDRFRVQSLEKILLSENYNRKQKGKILQAIARKATLLEIGFAKHGKEKEADLYQQKKNQALEQLASLQQTSAL